MAQVGAVALNQGVKCMRWRQIVMGLGFSPFLCIANESEEGLVNAGNAYSGARSVSWSSSKTTADSFQFRVSAFYPKGQKNPYSYEVELSTESNYWQYLKCEGSDRITAVSEDGESVLSIDLQYSNSFADGRSKEIFSATVPLQSIGLLEKSRAIIFSVCGTTGNITRDASEGARKVIQATL
jgi:hypothetical protein